MKKETEIGMSLFKIGRNIIWVCFTLAAALIFFLYCGHYVHINVEDTSMSLRSQQPLLFLASAVFIFFMGYFITKMKKVNPKMLFAVCMSLYLLVGLTIVFTIKAQLGADPMMVNKYVSCFLNGDYHGLEKGYYFSYWPVNLGMLTYEMPLYLINPSVRFLFAVNLFWIIVCEFCMWRITAMMFPGNNLIQNTEILFSFSFVPLLFHLVRVYGQVPGAAFVSLSALLWFREYYQKGGQSKVRSILRIAAATILMGLACMVRMNHMVAAIAVLIFSILFFLKERRPVLLVMAILMFVVGIGTPSVMRQCYRTITKIDFDGGVPYTSLVTMGLRENSKNRLTDGWNDGYNEYNYEIGDYDTQKADVIARRDLNEELQAYRKEPGRLIAVLRNKYYSTWCDPTYESISQEPKRVLDKGLITEVVGSLYDGDRVFDVYELFVRVVVFCIYGFSLIGGVMMLAGKEHPDEKWLLFCLYFVGVFLFHSFWETKSSYVYTCVFWLTPFAAQTADIVRRRICKIIEERKK